MQLKRVINDINGFSLIELMLVITIMAIMAGFATIGMDIIHRERVSSATKEMYATLEKARVDGMVTGPTSTADAYPYARGAGVRFQSSTQYVSFIFNDCNQDFLYQANTCAGSTREEAVAHTIRMPSGIELKINRSGLVNPNNDVLVFDRMGYARNDDWDSGDITLVLQHQTAGYTKCIHVGTNRIREGSWDGTNCIEE